MFTSEKFGRDGISNSTCTVNSPASSVTQAELFDDQWIYFTIPVTGSDLGTQMVWSVTSPEGEVLYNQSERIIEQEQVDNGCLWQGFALSFSDKPGIYMVEILTPANESLVYEITLVESEVPSPSDLPPLGNFTFGRDSIDVDDGCVVSNLIDKFHAGELDDDPWVYFSSTYSLDEVDNKLSYILFDPDGDVFSQGTRTLELQSDLCFWQGISLGGSDALTGVYFLLVEYFGDEIYAVEFEVLP